MLLSSLNKFVKSHLILRLTLPADRLATIYYQLSGTSIEASLRKCEMFEVVENRLFAYSDDSTILAARKSANRPAVAASLNRDWLGFRSGAITGA